MGVDGNKNIELKEKHLKSDQILVHEINMQETFNCTISIFGVGIYIQIINYWIMILIKLKQIQIM